MNAINPTISVVIPLYNKEKTVKRALDSIMKQTVLPQEIIVVDDGSTDESRVIVEREHNPLIRLLGQENSGVSAARNRGIREAQGAWIAFLDADDEWEPGYLEQIDRMIRQFPSCIGAATAYFLGNEKGSKRMMTLRKLPFATESGVLSNYFQVAVHSDPPLWTSAVCVNKQRLLEAGGFPSGIRSGEDLLTWARLAVAGDYGYCSRPLAVFWQEKAHTYQAAPSRIPEGEDYVGAQLLLLYKSYHGPQKRWFREYIGLWHKMRASVYLRMEMNQPALKETLLTMYYGHKPLKALVYLFLLMSPVKIRQQIFQKFSR